MKNQTKTPKPTTGLFAETETGITPKRIGAEIGTTGFNIRKFLRANGYDDDRYTRYNFSGKTANEIVSAFRENRNRETPKPTETPTTKSGESVNRKSVSKSKSKIKS